MEELQKLKNNGLTVVDCYCGAGVGGIGTEYAGFNTIFAFDNNKHAVRNFNKNVANVAVVLDAKKLDFDIIPDSDVITGGFPCFTGNTKILSKDGYKNIKDINTDDYVLSHTGKWRKVTSLMRSEKETFTIECSGFKDTITTENHPFYCVSVNNKVKSEPYWKSASKLTNSDYIGMAINKNSYNKLSLTNSECWLLGRYIADGHIDVQKRSGRINSYNSKIILSIGSNKVDSVKEILVDFNPTIHYHNTNTFRFIITSKRLTDIIQNYNFGRYSYNKEVPSIIQDLPKDKLKLFLDGYESGDGYESNDLVTCSTVSENLCFGIAICAYKVYGSIVGYSFIKKPKTTVIEGRTVNQKDIFRVRYKKTKSRIGFVKDGILWRKVTNVFKTGKVEKVYNISVDIDETYTANNIIVHNCKPWSVNGSEKGENCSKNGNLAQQLIDLILYKKPKAFLIENVKGLVNKKNMPYFDNMIKQLSTIFNVEWKVIDCSQYGVPQKRERVFIIGTRKDLNSAFIFPEQSEKVYSINDAIKDLPEVPDGLNNHEYNDKWTIRNDEKPFVHKVPEGGNWKDLPLADAKAFMKGAFNSSGGKTTFLAVMDRNKPSRTIMSSPMGKNSAQIIRFNKDNIRRYTVRESLRLQTVPDSWGFDKDTPIRVQYERCSGIPSLMSYKLMKQLYECLK